MNPTPTSERNYEIYQKHLNGVTMVVLAKEYHLSKYRVHAILKREKKLRTTYPACELIKTEAPPITRHYICAAFEKNNIQSSEDLAKLNIYEVVGLVSGRSKDCLKYIMVLHENAHKRFDI